MLIKYAHSLLYIPPIYEHGSRSLRSTRKIKSKEKPSQTRLYEKRFAFRFLKNIFNQVLREFQSPDKLVHFDRSITL